MKGQRSSALVPHLHERHGLTLLSGVHEVFVALETERLCKFVSLVMVVPTQAQLIRGECPETLCIEQGAGVLSCRFAEWTVRWTSRVLRMAVVSQSNENSSRQENRELPCREQHTLPLLSPKSHQPLLHIAVP